MKIMCFLFLFSPSLILSHLQGKVFHIHLSWSVDKTESSMVVTWATLDSSGSFVQYGFTSNYGYEVEGSSFYSTACSSYIHEVLIDDLQPDALFHYRCGSPGDWSSDHTFSTGLDKGRSSFAFIIYGDTRTDTIERIVVRNAIMMYKPKFILHCGDLIELGSNQNRWEIWFRQMEPLISNCPLMPTIGNHDEDGSIQNYLDQFSLPKTSGTEKYYSFTYGNLHIVSIYDSRNESRIEPGDSQYFWLVNDLDDANNDPGVKWKLIFYHVPPYSAGYGYQNQRTDIPPICDDYEVDVSFSGHTHNYQRTYMLYDDSITDCGPKYDGENDGTVYVVSGGGCAPLYDAYQEWWTAFSNKVYHFCLITVTDDELIVKAIGNDGMTTVDEWSISDSTDVVEDRKKQSDMLKIYPVPSMGSIIITGINPAKIDEVSVINSAGQRVKSFVIRSSSLIWDGRDDSNRQLNPGVYFIIIEEYGCLRSGKLILLR